MTMKKSNTKSIQNLERHSGYWRGRFHAMASPCELLIEVNNKYDAEELLNIAQTETLRIEKKFSRYSDNNIIFQINHAKGKKIEVDEETAGLLDYAHQCFELSDGLFDITSGVLRAAWHFDGSDNVPANSVIKKLVENIGWNKVLWESPYLTLPEGMEIDLGGVGKEYAVDRTALLLQQGSAASVLINYGGDLYANKARKNGEGWIIGIENPNENAKKQIKEYELKSGGVATSGDVHRYLLKDNIRYSHILNPKTGWPVSDAPRTITVIAGTCTEAGILSTFAMLQGKDAETFLQEQGVIYWCIR